MILIAFTVYDSKSETYGPYFFQKSPGEAIRNFSDSVNGQGGESLLARHPADFTLFSAGEFDQTTGLFTQYETLRMLGIGQQFRVTTDIESEIHRDG